MRLCLCAPSCTHTFQGLPRPAEKQTFSTVEQVGQCKECVRACERESVSMLFLFRHFTGQPYSNYSLQKNCSDCSMLSHLLCLSLLLYACRSTHAAIVLCAVLPRAKPSACVSSRTHTLDSCLKETKKKASKPFSSSSRSAANSNARI